ncbi:nuclear transport factor 2 family protein [Actinophytocola sp.]|uniref:nuclear transport factor 2 family protein n=1 Tax=Actinophytocola sp. TaxID=1872138 RepID=UPI002D375EB4|nr:nuclear transport factor 2 family protein [Actinophytocola sp.]HYQ67927.1 nuclear transport factor 2 family protein [Actinophytocola sp.]
MAEAPAQVVEELFRRIDDGRWGELAGLYAEDAFVAHPLRGTHVDGRTALGERFLRLGTFRMRVSDVVVHETTDPEVVVAEYRSRGPGFSAANVQVVRVRDGLITHSSDYHDHLRMAAARGDFTGLAVSYESSGGTHEPLVAAPLGSPRDVVWRLLDGISATIPGTRADLYADDAVVTHPFHPTAPPLTGKDELRQHFARGGGEGLRPRHVVFHDGADPELVVVEFEYAGRVGSGNPVVARNVFVTRVRDGLIVESRDYADHVAFAAATGRLPDLLAAARSVVTAD